MNEHWRKRETTMIDISSIKITERILTPTKARIAAMAKSLSEEEVGQLNPILITKHLMDWRVVAGATRLLAAKELGWVQIEATIIGADNDYEYKLIEIAENLDRHDLSDTDRKRLKIKERELRAARLAHFEKLAAGDDETTPKKAKGGRGKKGGVREAARQAGVPNSTAHDRVTKKPSGKTNPDSLVEAKRIADKYIDREGTSVVQGACAAAAADTPEECWQRSLANNASEAVALPALWSREFGDWKKFSATSDLVTLAQQAADAWAEIARQVARKAGITSESATDLVNDVDANGIPKFLSGAEQTETTVSAHDIPSKLVWKDGGALIDISGGGGDYRNWDAPAPQGGAYQLRACWLGLTGGKFGGYDIRYSPTGKREDVQHIRSHVKDLEKAKAIAQADADEQLSVN